ncbi:MAG TPA: hypothetical protein VHO06_02110 [Polyangia bacterium]|nr:hypothetical protein [Polyangia bacterium]
MSELVEATRRFLDSGSDLTKRREARREMAALVALDDQRVREEAALRAFCRAYVGSKGFSRSRDIHAIYHMFGEYTGVVSWTEGRSVERTAELFRRPVGYLSDLRDRAMRALTAPATIANRRAA